jgi:hypothetical protein
MSTLVAQTISNGTVSTSSANVIQGSAKAWVNFNGTTSPGTIRKAYNVSSVTKNGVGDYTVNFTNSLSDANYCVTGTCQQSVFSNADCGSVSPHRASGTSALTTTSVRLDTTNTATTTGGAIDMLAVYIAILG